MPVRALVRFPDPRLARPAARVETFGDDLAALVEDIRDTLVSEAAIGLTAPHLGVSQRVFVTRMAPEAAPRAYVNPIILDASAETATYDEGSVSMPGIRERVTRPAASASATPIPAGCSTRRRRRGSRPPCSSTRSTSWTASSGSTACPA